MLSKNMWKTYPEMEDIFNGFPGICYLPAFRMEAEG